MKITAGRRPVATIILCAAFVATSACDDGSDDVLADRVAVEAGLDDYEVLAAVPEVDDFAAELALTALEPDAPLPTAPTEIVDPAGPVAGVHCGEFPTDWGGDGACGYCSFGGGNDTTTCFANEAACGASAGACVYEHWVGGKQKY
jgi:hypothetical protein